MNIPCKVHGSTTVEEMTGVLEPEVRFEKRYAVGIIKVAATVAKGTIPVRIFNSNSKPRRVYLCSTIGNLIPLIESGTEFLGYECVKTVELRSETTHSHCMTAKKGGNTDKIRRDMTELFPINNSAVPYSEKKADL